ncbi:MAG: hypothetical protein ACE5J2_01210 [Nitrososphaerales archaeon]
MNLPVIGFTVAMLKENKRQEWLKMASKIGGSSTSVCTNCKSSIMIRWEPTYNGYRGYCPRCNSDWPES